MVEHIGLVTTSYPLEGAEGQAAAGAFVADFARELSRHVRVSVVAPAPVAALEWEGDLTVRFFRAPRLPLSLLSPRRPDHWPAILRTLRNGQRAVLELCADSRVDHLLALWVLPSGEWARVAGERYGVPYSTWALCSDIWSLGRIPGVRRWVVRALVNAQRCYADGHGLAGAVHDLSGCDCQFMPSSRLLPVAKVRIPRDRPPYQLAYLGRWHPNKGVDLLLDALDLLSDRDWRSIVEVRIHGGGPLAGQVRDQVCRLARLGRPVSYGGYLDRQAAAELLQWADFLLLPSRVESIPVVFSDAMQAGCPVIAMPVGDLPTLVGQHGTGYCATDVDAAAFSEVIGKALSESPRRFFGGMLKAREDFALSSTAQRLLGELFDVTGQAVP